eukprot:TRINITY_DN23114_c0_g1_i1.p1 TRINITY_DN23114_c0_g1~~TRINITY_DN23114_c0_g1_i1.p1  ORF type:complete len:842 (-),score=160.90 TRINITY_DN23114_c0_g1_i1:45-2570(-)
MVASCNGRQGPYAIPNALRTEEKINSSAAVDSLCPLCGYTLERGWPFVRVVLTRRVDGEGLVRLCHLVCAKNALKEAMPGTEPSHACLEDSFAGSLQELLRRSPQIWNRNPAVRFALEEERLAEAGAEGALPSWPLPPMPFPPEAAFSIEGVTEARISCCTQLTRIPPEIGRFRWVQTMCMMSNSLESLPSEVGDLHGILHLYLNGNFLRTLPAAVCQLPKLQEVCLDANRLEHLPPFTSQDLKLFTAPANRLSEAPSIAAHLERLELHGNFLTSLSSCLPKRLSDEGPDRFRSLISLKVMGNQLKELPREVAGMPALRILTVSGNRLEALPDELASLQRLEWLLAYENCLRQLPKGLALGSPALTRLLLESNPLEPADLAALLADTRRSKIKTLGLDAAQVQQVDADILENLPSSVSVGTVVPVPGCSQVCMKLTRATQLRRQDGAPLLADPWESPPEMLIVAFAASQGEPEWLGFLRRLLERGQVSPLPPASDTSLQKLMEGAEEKDFDCRMFRLWAGSPCGRTHSAEVADGPALPLADFDVLTVVDHRMRWYSEDGPAVSAALENVRRKYSRVLCVGASMGGFGALLHGSRISDAVLAFSPQANLPEACLRPPAENPRALQELSEALFASLQGAACRGVQVDVHCAADEHLLHALTMPLGGISLVVHPLMPRKPFARILDRAQLLLPVVADAVFRLLGGAPTGSQTPDVSVGCWCRGGQLRRHPSTASQLLRLFFGPGCSMLPRPGDWFCGNCCARNAQDSFFCWKCRPQGEKFGSPITTRGSVRVRDNHDYPGPTDWGCTSCGMAHCAYQWKCTHCGANQNTGIMAGGQSDQAQGAS